MKKPTHKQRNLAKVTIENLHRLPEMDKAELVELGGYGKATQHTPSKVLESQGYKQALKEYGLTEELIAEALVEDIKAKKGKRIAELSLGAELLGMKQKTPNIIPMQFNINTDREAYK